METIVRHSIVQMEAEELRQLVTEVKETVAEGYRVTGTSKKTSFGIIDLWNIQRKKRTATLNFRRVI
jgi:RecB family endonuclease NucS